MLLRLAALALLAGACNAADWRPVTPDELALAADPAAPNANAIFLYREVDRDDQEFYEREYRRIKILKEEGRDLANVEIEYVPERESVSNVRARVIQPDGRATDFDGTIYDKTLVRARGASVQAKTFTLPGAGVGSIIEYRYTRNLSSRWLFDSRWLLSESLYTREGHFSLVPNENFSLTWSWPAGLPAGSDPPKKGSRRISLDMHDVPAFVEEESMPPAETLKYRVEFDYSDPGDSQTDPDAYWKHFAKDRYRKVGSFIDAQRAMAQAVAQVVAPGDDPATRARKIYERVQQVRNLSFEHDRSEQELKAEKLRDRDDVADVWNYGYGDGEQITWLYLALARAAGLTADPVLVSTRDRRIFRPELMNGYHLNTNVVRVMLDGQAKYVDPGSRYVTFGMLPWEETQVRGLKLDRDGGEWVSTPGSAAGDSRIERHADLELAADGSLRGKLRVVYSGLEARGMRVDERDADALARRKFLEQQVRDWVPVGIDVKLVNEPAWSASSDLLVADFELGVPGWATVAGERLLVPAGLFGGAEHGVFEHAERTYPIYFTYPYQRLDDVRIRLPDGLQLANPLPPRRSDLGALVYLLAAEQEKGLLRLRREFTVDAAIVPVKYYSKVRDFYQALRSGDDTQLVLARTGAAPAAVQGQKP